MTIHDIIQTLEDDGAIALHDVEQMFEAFARTIVSNGGRTLLAMAMQAVQAVEADPTLLTSADKRDAAIASIVPALKATGTPILMSAIASAVEVAFAGMSAGQAPVTNTTIAAAPPAAPHEG